jgi:hemolysin type calcium-binding protein
LRIFTLAPVTPWPYSAVAMPEQVDHALTRRRNFRLFWIETPAEWGLSGPGGLYYAPLLFSFAHKTHVPLIVILTAVALFSSVAVATPAGRIVVEGSAAGSHLRLSSDGFSLSIAGAMADAPPHGCRFTHGHDAATCPLAGASAIELNMGDGGDFVEVLDPLPFSLTAHLGSGQDKFVGNGEVDLCYPEGSRRNRCIGEGGSDVCITGEQNSDCVGGAGDDYCRTSAGSDGCWGGPGDDVCFMGAGQDGCHGEAGDDRLYGELDPDQLYGGEGFDYCDGGPGKGQSSACETGPRH